MLQHVVAQGKNVGANRGPAAAAENREALLESARRLFAARGYHVALSAIARDAGVGQGSLYRHFPTRLDLALAIFEENFTVLERIAASDPGPGCFLRLWRRLIGFTVESTAFVETAVDARRQLVDPALTVGDLMLLQRMVYGAIVTEVDPASASAVAVRALELVDERLAWGED